MGCKKQMQFPDKRYFQKKKNNYEIVLFQISLFQISLFQISLFQIKVLHLQHQLKKWIHYGNSFYLWSFGGIG
jgi:hypothetical protein